MATAAGELTTAEARLQQVEARADLEVATARDALTAAHEALALSRVQRDLAREQAVLVQHAFDLGEQDLPALLRARAAAAEAALALVRQEVADQAAVARLNQALGVVP